MEALLAEAKRVSISFEESGKWIFLLGVISTIVVCVFFRRMKASFSRRGLIPFGRYQWLFWSIFLLAAGICSLSSEGLFDWAPLLSDLLEVITLESALPYLFVLWIPPVLADIYVYRQTLSIEEIENP